MLGSASVEIEIAPPACDVAMRLLFSADSGPDHKLLHPDPEGPTGIDFVVCDSTYGDTDREPVDVERRREVPQCGGASDNDARRRVHRAVVRS